MFKKLAGIGIAATIAAIGLVGVDSRSAPPAHAQPLNALMLNQETCFLIGTAFGGGVAIECASAGGVGNFALNLSNMANRLAKRDLGDTTKPSLADFKGIDLDKNQLHQVDGQAFIAVFLNDQGPIDISVSNAEILPINSLAPVGNTYRCDTSASGTGGDPDCVEGATGGDGAYVFAIVPDSRSVRGPGMISIVQERYPIDIPFTVVGEPNSVSIVTLKTTLQVGASDLKSTLPFTKDDCKLAASASGFLDANGTPERTVALAIVKDIDGTAISGASIVWSSDDPDIASTATDFTPTIDLGSFGVGAPEILCGTKMPGTTKIRVKTVAFGPAGPAPAGLPLDVAAREVRAFKEVTVTGFPDAVALAAAPASLDCDGTASSTVSATVLTSEGTPVQDGNDVTFDVQLLGTANPILAKTKGGVATSVITPLRIGEAKGVTVNVSVPTGKSTKPISGIRKDNIAPLEDGIFVACSGPAAGAAAGAGAGTAAGSAKPGPAGIHGPDTGSSGTSAPDAVTVWPLLALFAAAMTLVAARTALKRD
jgi:hypothetical protein